MNKQSPCSMQSVLMISILLVIGIFISYGWVDRSVVWFLAKHNLRSIPLLKIFANDIVLALTAVMVIFYIQSGIRILFSKDHPIDLCAFHCVALAVLISAFIKDALKYMFGRYWPSSFGQAQDSLIANNHYGFHWFHGSESLGSFPSGHATFIIAFAVSMTACYPKLRWIAWILAALVCISQIGMYYHFVSDVLAGVLLGYLTAKACVRIFKQP
jgi:membrane-associated phospholipid phosphatase